MEHEFPEYPKWIYLLEGDQFQKYMNFVKTRDFNKILSSAQDAADTSQPPSYQKDWTAQQVTSLPVDPVVNPEGEYSEIAEEKPLPLRTGFLTPEEMKERRRRTRTYVILGILVLSLVAMMVALLVHFHLQKSLFGSTSSETTVVTTPAPFYQSFTPQESKSTKQTTVRSSTNTNNNAASLGTGSVSLKPLTKSVLAISSFSDDVTTDLPEVSSTSVTASNVVATLSDKSISIECILNGMAAWEYIIVEKVSANPGDIVELAKVSSQSHGTSNEIVTKDIRIEARVVRAGSRTKVVIELSPPVCTDHGNYVCTAIIKPTRQLSSRFKVALSSPVRKPVLHMPIEVVENKPTKLKITWDSGFPASAGDLQFVGIEEEKLTCEENSMDECVLVTRSCEVIPQIANNMSAIQAKVTLATDGGVTSLVSPSENLFVVPDSVCSHTNERYIQHPYTCGKFIECTAPVLHVFECPDDACFNSDPDACIQSATNSSSTSI